MASQPRPRPERIAIEVESSAARPSHALAEWIAAVALEATRDDADAA